MADKLRFTAVFEPADEGWIYAHVPELPEVHTQGRDLNEARMMLEDAIRLVIADRHDRGEPIPDTSWAITETIDVSAALSDATSSGTSQLTGAARNVKAAGTHSG